MPHLARHLAFAACLIFIGSAADAAPNRHREVAKAKQRHKGAPLVERATERDDDAADDTSDERDAEFVDAPAKVHERAAEGLRSWHFAIGPNVWAASVDANVAVGAKSVGAAIDFFQLSRHTRYGVPVLVEARYRRLSFVGDMLYGVIALTGAKDVGPLMVKLDGTVSSLLVDGIAGYRLLGGDDSVVSLEARGGIRYQRTAIAGSVGVSGNGISPPASVNAGADVLAGARVFVRPFSRLYFAGTVDHSLFGSSTSTWSAGIDANVRIMSRVLLAAGWRTLTQQSAPVSTVMHGPHAALQLLF